MLPAALPRVTCWRLSPDADPPQLAVDRDSNRCHGQPFRRARMRVPPNWDTHGARVCTGCKTAVTVAFTGPPRDQRVRVIRTAFAR